MKKTNIFGSTRFVHNDVEIVWIESTCEYYVANQNDLPMIQRCGFSYLGQVEQFAKMIDDVLFIGEMYELENDGSKYLSRNIEGTLVELNAQRTLDGCYYVLVEDNKKTFYESVEPILKRLDKLCEKGESGSITFATILNSTQDLQTVLAAISTRDLTKNMIRVKSSNIWAWMINIKERKDREGDVFIQFKGPKGGGGDIYQFFSVPINVWRRLITSPSAGHAFWVLIRDKYSFRKLTGDKKTKMRGGIN